MRRVLTTLWRWPALIVGGLAVFAAAASSSAAPPATIGLTPLDTFFTGAFDEGAAEIVKFDAKTDRLFVINAQDARVDVLDASDPYNLVKVGEIDSPIAGGAANSVDVYDGLVAVAIEADPKTDNGIVAFYDAESLNLLGTVGVGALPDMVTFTPDGSRVLSANEGEPSGYNGQGVDPEGSVSVIEIKRPRAAAYRAIQRVCRVYCPSPSNNGISFQVTTIGFGSFNNQKDSLIAAGVRIFGPGATVAQDLEPEFITVSADNSKAYVTLQENNAIAVLDLRRLRVERILPLGYKDHSLPGNGLDGSDRDGPGNDGKINIANWPIYGMYMPDGIDSYQYNRRTFLVTANEGDAREWPGFEPGEEDDGVTNEAVRLKNIDDFGLGLDPAVFSGWPTILTDDGIGRLEITLTMGDEDNDGLLEKIYSFGGRSFSIWDDRGNLVFDSGDQIEQVIAEIDEDDFPTEDIFNSNHDENDSFDTRSDGKGPEPEGVVIGQIGWKTYAFVGLERQSGIMIWDISNPYAPVYAGYFSNRDFDSSLDVEDAVEAMTPGLDLGPEGLDFIPAKDSPIGKPLLVVGNEVSGTTTVYSIDFLP